MRSLNLYEIDEVSGGFGDSNGTITVFASVFSGGFFSLNVGNGQGGLFSTSGNVAGALNFGIDAAAVTKAINEAFDALEKAVDSFLHSDHSHSSDDSDSTIVVTGTRPGAVDLGGGYTGRFYSDGIVTISLNGVELGNFTQTNEGKATLVTHAQNPGVSLGVTGKVVGVEGSITPQSYGQQYFAPTPLP